MTEWVRAGLSQARLEGRHIGKLKLEMARDAVLRDRAQGMSLNELARKHQASRSSVCKLLKKASNQGGQTPVQSASASC